MFDIRKYLPGYIEIRSIYWQEKMLEVQDELKTIHDLADQFFDMEDANKAIKLRSKIEWLIGIYDRKYADILKNKTPMYFYEQVIKINTAKMMLDFWDTPLE